MESKKLSSRELNRLKGTLSKLGPISTKYSLFNKLPGEFIGIETGIEPDTCQLTYCYTVALKLITDNIKDYNSERLLNHLTYRIAYRAVNIIKMYRTLTVIPRTLNYLVAGTHIILSDKDSYEGFTKYRYPFLALLLDILITQSTGILISLLTGCIQYRAMKKIFQYAVTAEGVTTNEFLYAVSSYPAILGIIELSRVTMLYNIFANIKMFFFTTLKFLGNSTLIKGIGTEGFMMMYNLVYSIWRVSLEMGKVVKNLVITVYNLVFKQGYQEIESPIEPDSTQRVQI